MLDYEGPERRGKAKMNNRAGRSPDRNQKSAVNVNDFVSSNATCTSEFKFYKVVISTKRVLVPSGVSVCIKTHGRAGAPCVCHDELHYPDKLLWERPSRVFRDIDWGDDPVSLYPFQLAVTFP